MTGTWWSLSATLLPLISVALITPVYCRHTEDYRLTFVLAIKNNESGLEIYTLFPENRGSIDIDASGVGQHKLEPEMHLFIPGRNLSSECGDQYFRCQELLVEDDINIVFVPLENGLLFLSYWYDLNTTTMEWNMFIVNKSDCSPTVFFKINSKFYMVCSSSYEYFFTVYEVHLNLSGSVIEDVKLLGPLTRIRISPSLSSSSSSNFILVEQKIYLAVGNNIIVLNVFDSLGTRQLQYPEKCHNIHKLVPAVDDDNQHILVAYCSDRYIYFNPVCGDWNKMQLFSMYGIPYFCPDNDYTVTLFNNSKGEYVLQFSVRGSVPIPIRNVSISSGICFKSQNRTYFAYSDQQHNSVFVYDFIAQNHYPVSPYDCLDCPQLLLLGDQYLVVRDADHADLILDTKTNFSLITNISSDVPDILAVLHSNIITPSPPIIHNTTTVKVPAVTASPTVTPTHISLPQSNFVWIILTVIIGLFVIIILVTVVVGFCVRYRRNKWCNKMYRIPRLKFVTDQRPPVPLLAADSDQEEDDESYEMESMAHFRKGCRTTTV